jgi:hypothetical protein
MNRRRFLKGTLAGVAASTALVSLATPEESALLLKGQPILIGHPLQSVPDPATPEVYMRRPDGGFVCVGIVTQITVTAPAIDASLAWEGVARYVPGLREGMIYFEGQDR